MVASCLSSLECLQEYMDTGITLVASLADATMTPDGPTQS